MIKDSDFYCQFVSYTNDNIARSTCGVTSLAMVLSAKGVFSQFKNSDHLLDDFFEYINSLHKNDLPCVKRKISFRGRVLPVTVGLESQIVPEVGDYVETDSNFFPTFVLYRGYDHRASQQVLKTFGLSGMLKENVTLKEIIDLFKTKKCEYFLASVKSKFIKKPDKSASTHIVVVQKVYQNTSGHDMLQYVDPAAKNHNEAIIDLNILDFSKIYNGFGTIVS